MDKVTAGLVGVVAGLATMGCAHAATADPGHAADPMQASSYADLLAPVPNARDLLRASDATGAQTSAPDIQLAYWNDRGGYGEYGPGPYYHHHHHQYYHPYARNYHHHHHHHYQREYGNYVGVPGFGGFVFGR